MNQYRRQVQFLDDDGETKTADELMLEVSPLCFVNELSAWKIGFVHSRPTTTKQTSKAPVASIVFNPQLDKDHPYKTNTRFMQKDDGTYTTVPLPPSRDIDVSRHVSTPEERAAARLRIAAKAEIEEKAVAKARRRFNKRQRIGDPNCEQSRDEDFPLLAVLRRDDNEDAIKVVIAYRELVALCAADPIKGVSYSGRDAAGLFVEYRSVLRDAVAEVDAAKKAGWQGDRVPGGEIEYDGRVKRSKGAYALPAKRKLAVEYGDGCEGTGRTESLHVKVTEDVIIDRVDRFPVLMRIRSALGPLVDAFEDAVLGGQTLTKIGNDGGFTGVVAATAGKALVMQAISAVEPFLFTKKHKAANDNYLIEKRKIA